jgi:hypothetical protein
MEISNATFSIIVTFIVICHIKAMEFVYKKGSKYYNKNLVNNKKNKKYLDVWDIIHNNFKDYSNLSYAKNWYTVLFLVPIIMNMNYVSIEFIKEFVLKFCIIVFLRSLTIIVTILPKNTSTQPEKKLRLKPKKYEKLSLFDKMVSGGCYDKMFSGHFAFGVLLTLLIFKYNIVSMNILNVISFVLINMFHLMILSITRSHYTMDMIVSLYVTLFVYNLNVILK